MDKQQEALDRLVKIVGKLLDETPLTWEEAQAARAAIDGFGAQAAATLNLLYDGEEQQPLDKFDVENKLVYINDPF